jgi:hypothetical protein
VSRHLCPPQGEAHTVGTSGPLDRSNHLMVDRQTWYAFFPRLELYGAPAPGVP